MFLHHFFNNIRNDVYSMCSTTVASLTVKNPFGESNATNDILYTTDINSHSDFNRLFFANLSLCGSVKTKTKVSSILNKILNFTTIKYCDKLTQVMIEGLVKIMILNKMAV